MQTVHQEAALHIVGIELRTSNEEAFRTIPPHWQRFGDENVLAAIRGQTSGGVYAVYTNFENAGRGNEGLYSLVIGAAVPPGTPVPQGMVRAVVPASRRAVFPVEKGRPDLVGAKWQEIWRRGDLPKTYIADYEHYAADGSIAIHVGIERETMPA